MPGGESQQPGGWNRVVLRVADLPAQIETALIFPVVGIVKLTGLRKIRSDEPQDRAIGLGQGHNIMSTSLG